MWCLQTDYLTDPLEHGNYGMIMFDSEAEARDWWAVVKPIVANYTKVQTLWSPEGALLEIREIKPC